MKSEIRREINRSWLIIRGEEASDSYEVRMITENTIPGLLPCSSRRVDDCLQLCYEISDMMSIKCLMENRKIKAGELLTLLENLCLSLDSLEEYLLVSEHLLIDPEFIYADHQMERVLFCYMPEKTQLLQEAFQTLTEYLLPRLDHRDPQAVTLGYGIYRYSLESEFRIDSLRVAVRDLMEKNKEACIHTSMKTEQEQLWEEEERQADKMRREEAIKAFFEDEEEAEVSPGKSAAAVIGAVSFYLACFLGIWFYRPPWISIWVLVGMVSLLSGAIFFFMRIRRKKREEIKEEEIKEEKNDEGENGRREYQEVFAGSQICTEANRQEKQICGYRFFPDTGTCYLGAKQTTQETSLLSEDNKYREKYCLREISGECGEILCFPEQSPILIGKMQGTADLILSAPTVSRIHARIRQQDGKWYLKDMNSKNGTYKNGERIQREQEVMIQEGDELQFAEKRYVFSREWTDIRQ